MKLNKGIKMLLWEEIVLAEIEIYKQTRLLNNSRYALSLLIKRRKDCKHKFPPPIKNYEHEGSVCKLCGINELSTY